MSTTFWSRGQHQRIRSTPAPADVGRAFAGDQHLFIGHDRPGRKVQARLAHARAFAQEQLDRAFFGPHRVERHEGPGRHQRQRAKGMPCRVKIGPPTATARAAGAAVVATPAHQDAQLFLTALHQLVDLGESAGRPAAGRPRRSSSSATLAPAAAPPRSSSPEPPPPPQGPPLPAI
jgi:hypothetical protein